MKKIGLILNPVAGVGGPAGLKGSDGAEIQEMAKKLGIQSAAPRRATVVLEKLATEKDKFVLLTAPGEMGADAAKAAGYEPQVVGEIEAGKTTPEDTIRIARLMRDEGIDLLLFAGGDGTARNLSEAIGTSQLALGIPSGVKIHSGVYATNPQSAAELAWRFIRDEELGQDEAEVMDIDEDKFRQEVVDARLYGYMTVLQHPQLMQCCKSAGTSTFEALSEIANEVMDYIEDHDEFQYVIGSGTSTRGIMELLELPNTLLGVDVVYDYELVAKDVNEPQLYELVKDKPTKIVITVIGGQGHILGRGNQQLSPRVLRAVGLDNIIIIADPNKLMLLQNNALIVDSGDPELDKELCGYRHIIVGANQTKFMKVTTGL